MTNPLDNSVHDFLLQQRIAVVGVSRSEKEHPAGSLIYRKLRKNGHEVFAVNPQMQSFEGDRCYSDVRSIPGGVSAAVIVTRPDQSEKVVRECDEAGVRHVWMHQSLAKGTSVSREAVNYCRAHGIAVIAGACPMMYGPDADFGHMCMRWLLKVAGKLPA